MKRVSIDFHYAEKRLKREVARAAKISEIANHAGAQEPRGPESR